MPVIDHAATREPESLNWGARRRELVRITQENRGIVHRIQGSSSYYPSKQWANRSAEHDRHLLLVRRPATSERPVLPMPPSPIPSSGPPARRPRSMRARPRRAAGGPQLSSLLHAAQEGDAHLLVGLASGFVAGAPLVLQPQEENEEAVFIHETWLRKDGLVVLLKDPVRRAHPVGAHVLTR